MDRKPPKKSIQKESKIVSARDPATTGNSIDEDVSRKATFRSPVRMASPSAYREVVTRPGKRPGERLDIGNAIADNVEGLSRLAIRLVQSTLSGTSDIINTLTGAAHYDSYESHCGCHHEHPCCHTDEHMHHHHGGCCGSHGEHGYVVSRCGSVHGC